MTFSRKIILVIVSTFIGLVFIVAGLSDVILLSSYRQLEAKNVLGHVQQVYNLIQNRLEQNDVTARDLALGVSERLQSGNRTADVASRYFSEINLKLHQIDFAAVYSPDATLQIAKKIDCETGVYCSIETAEQRSMDAMVRGLGKGGRRIYNGVVDIGGSPCMVSLKPLSATSGQERGILVAGCFLDRSELDKITKLTGLEAGLVRVDSPEMSSDAARAHVELTQSDGFYSGVIDETVVAGYAHLKDIHGQPSYIVKIHDKRSVFQQAKNSIYYILIVLVVSGAVFCGVMLLFIRGAVLKRLAELSGTVGEISRRQDMSARIENKGEDELDDLAVSINSMLASLQDAEQALKESEERYRSLFEKAPDSIIIIGTEGDEAGRIVAANQAAAAQHGYSIEELCSLRIYDLNTPEANVVAKGIMRRIVAGEWVTFELWHYRKDGSQFPIEVHAGPFRIQGRNYVLGFDRDITARKLAEESDRMYLEQIRHLNEELGRQAAELALANQELEAFNYSVSHDMRGPLTRISGYCQLMLDDNVSLDPQTRSYLTRIYESSCWLDEMIEAMLKLAQLARAGFVSEEVDLSQLCEEQVMNLKCSAPERSVESIIAPGVVVQGDRSLLKIMICNLLNNAWKYSAKVPEARIEFGLSEGEGGGTTFFVRDNGIGFDMNDSSKMFRVFTRLHDPTQYSGSGIGLATVQRIISRHGGRVWAVGEAGKGATFYFTLAPDTRSQE